MPPKFWTAGEQARAVELRRGGLKVAAIAKRLDRSPDSVTHKLCRLGVVVEPEKRNRPDRGRLRIRVAAALRAGGTVADVADRYGCSHTYVSHIRKALGIPPRSRSELSWVFRKARGDRTPNRWAGRQTAGRQHPSGPTVTTAQSAAAGRARSS